jgi:alpha-D-xyloside xylohydrolase
MPNLAVDGSALVLRDGHETVRIEPWGPHSVRVRASVTSIRDDLPQALLPAEPPRDVEIDQVGRRLRVGHLEVTVSEEGLLSFADHRSGVEVLGEEVAHFQWPGARLFARGSSGAHRVEQRFRAHDDERIVGLGQHPGSGLDRKGSVVDLVQRNSEVSIPFYLSSRGYGFLWNSPAVGRVELGRTSTRWVADSARQIDYWVTVGSPAEVLAAYADATGHAPELPEFAAGYWQSKLLYRNKDELLEVAREYARRELPLAVIVTDYFHWTHLGDWQFDSDGWSDPEAMVSELQDLGVRPLVSVWPSVSPLSRNYEHMRDAGMLVATESGMPFHQLFPDKGFHETGMGVAFYDPTSPEARTFVWDQVKRGYYDLGYRIWWLDACEPEIFPHAYENLRYAAGPGLEVANLYPREHARAFHDGMRREGEDEVVLLCRSAWAGSQSLGVVLWSGDVQATWESFREQVVAGLSVMCSGIPWWNSDTGGFHGGDPDSPEYRELYLRWFQFATFSPIMRAHGHREPRIPFGAEDHGGGGNEVWSYGPDAEQVLVDHLTLRERLKPYVLEHMRIAARDGLPMMRPLLVDHPEDERAWQVEDQYLFGPDMLVAPVLEAGAVERSVYLPAGVEWTDVWTGERHPGGSTVRATAPLERTPVFVSDPALLPLFEL